MCLINTGPRVQFENDWSETTCSKHTFKFQLCQKCNGKKAIYASQEDCEMKLKAPEKARKWSMSLFRLFQGSRYGGGKRPNCLN